jgi:hypothetical protein
MIKKWIRRIGIVVVLAGFIVNPTFADTHNYTDVSSNHWAYPTISTLVEAEIFEKSNVFGLGNAVTESDLINWLVSIDDKVPNDFIGNIPAEKSTTKQLTRLDALKLMISLMDFGAVADQMKLSSVPFTDVTVDKGYVKMALDFGLVSENQNKLFRPNDLLKKEEAAVLIKNLYIKQRDSFDHLLSYYAINSYSQAEYSSELTEIAHGWSRLELSSDKSSVVLNTTSANNNEYRIPIGFRDALNATEQDNLSRYLMVFVKEENIYDTDLKKSIPLSEYILKNDSLQKKTIAEIQKVLSQQSYFSGVLIDFESLRGNSSALNLNKFLDQLKEALNPGKYKIATAVHPARPNGLSYYDGYDFKHIGEVSDLVILMAHDYYAKRLTESEMSSGLTITPLTPINEVYYAIDSILDPVTGVDQSEKVLLQLSMDTAQWKVADGKIINSTPFNPSYGAILSRIEEGAITEYSSRYHSPSIIFRNESDNTRNIVWYENQRSIQAKIDLAKYFGLGGISVWRMGTIPSYKGTTLDLWHQIMLNY